MRHLLRPILADYDAFVVHGVPSGVDVVLMGLSDHIRSCEQQVFLACFRQRAVEAL